MDPSNVFRIRPAIPAVILLVALLAGPVLADDTVAPGIAWQRLLGGGDGEAGRCALPTPDGGYLLLGEAASGNGDVAGPTHGGLDVWVVKLDGSGAILWQRLLGGSGDEYAGSLVLTPDGGCAFAGTSYSSGSGTVSGTSSGGSDAWVVKLDAAGAVAWQRLLGGSGDDYGYEIERTVDGGYVLSGFASAGASGNITVDGHGNRDAWVARLDPTGAVVWQHLFGGSGDDRAASVRQAPDGGFIAVGFSDSPALAGSTATGRGSYDAWAARLSGEGTVAWQRLLGGGVDDRAASVLAESDGYVFLGQCASSDGDVPANPRGDGDFWLAKLDSAGGLVWQHRFGGSGDDRGFSLESTRDGGYALLGFSDSNANGDVIDPNHGDDFDFWLVKLGPDRRIAWQRLLGGANYEYAETVRETPDGGYILTGFSTSSMSGDVTSPNHGHPTSDLWVVRLRGGNANVTPVPGATKPPTDTDGDGLYDDVNGNGVADYADIVLYFQQMEWLAANEPLSAFDCNDNGAIDFADVIWLFNRL